MGKNTVKFIIVLIMTTLSMGAFAQVDKTTPQGVGNEILVGSTFKYRVDLNVDNTYQWNVYKDGSSTAESDKTNVDIKQPTSNLTDIEWKTPGTYVLEMVETSAAGCSANPVSFTVVVKANDAEIAWTEFPAVDCATTTYTFKLQLTGAKYPATLKYTLVDESGGNHGGDVTSDDSGLFVISVTDFVVNKGQLSYSTPIEITEVKDKYGVVPLNFTVANEDFLEVRPLVINRYPNTSGIKHD